MKCINCCLISNQYILIRLVIYTINVKFFVNLFTKGRRDLSVFLNFGAVSRNKMLPKKIVRFLLFFDTSGFNSQFTHISDGRKATIINIVHILMAVSFTIYAFLFLPKFYYSFGLIETINEFVEYSGSLCVYWWKIFHDETKNLKNNIKSEGSRSRMNAVSSFELYRIKWARKF